MPMPPKQIQCRCGHTMSVNTRKLRCVKCGDFLFYDEAERSRHRKNAFYVTAMFVLAAGILTYLFIELIVDPLMRL